MPIKYFLKIHETKTSRTIRGNKYTIRVGNFKTPLSVIDSKDIEVNDIISPLDLSCICRTLHPTIAHQLLQLHVDYLPRQTISCVINEILIKNLNQSMFSEHNEIKLEINNKDKGKHPNSQKLNNTLLNNLWIKEKSVEKLENILN